MQLHGLINGQEDFWNEEKNLHLCKVKLRIDDLRLARKLQLSRQLSSLIMKGSGYKCSNYFNDYDIQYYRIGERMKCEQYEMQMFLR